MQINFFIIYLLLKNYLIFLHKFAKNSYDIAYGKIIAEGTWLFLTFPFSEKEETEPIEEADES